jgi:cysteinyl-tRNA synthetase
MQWPSPWGVGYPGWHLECSAMSMKYLGESFDIHGGGIENQFPHHDDEIAQSEAATGKPFARYWLHNNMVTVGGQKMGKSLGNFITLKDAFAKWDPMVLRLFILQSHYRSPLDFSDEALAAATEGYRRLAESARAINDATYSPSEGMASSEVSVLIAHAERAFTDAMDDDFGTAAALAVMFDFVREVNGLLASGSLSRQSALLLRTAYQTLCSDILGISLSGRRTGAEDVLRNITLQMLIEIRNQARTEKKYAVADHIRKTLYDVGIILEDTPGGTVWKRKWD